MRIRAASKIAPLPRSSPKICDEWPCEPRHLEPPRAEPAPADHGRARLVALEGERHVAARRGLAQRRAALLVGRPGVLLVAREDDDHPAILQRAGRVQRRAAPRSRSGCRPSCPRCRCRTRARRRGGSARPAAPCRGGRSGGCRLPRVPRRSATRCPARPTSAWSTKRVSNPSAAQLGGVELRDGPHTRRGSPWRSARPPCGRAARSRPRARVDAREEALFRGRELRERGGGNAGQQREHDHGRTASMSHAG